MNKKLTLAITGTAFAFGSLGALAAPAGAHHQHYLETPSQTILLPCEPAGSGAEEIHPIHNGLHMNPSQDDRAITVGKYTGSSCAEPLPSGPVR